MGFLHAITDAMSSTLADQWKEIITVKAFSKYEVLLPGTIKSQNNMLGENTNSSEGVISNGSLILVPDNTVAFIFNQDGIENVITEAGNYIYEDGEESIFNKDTSLGILIDQTVDRISFGGIPSQKKRIAFVNLKEIRGIKFGTPGPQVYHDKFYDVDLEVLSHGEYSIKITNPTTFIRNFVPANENYYSLESLESRGQINSEFIQSFIVALNSLSSEYKVSELPGKATQLAEIIAEEKNNVGSWPDRFGLELVRVAIESIGFSKESRTLIQSFSQKKLDVDAYKNTQQTVANIAAQQQIASGVKENGLGDASGMVLGMNIAQTLNNQTSGIVSTTSVPTSSESTPDINVSFNTKIENLRKIKALLDEGVLTNEEFQKMKKDILSL